MRHIAMMCPRSLRYRNLSVPTSRVLANHSGLHVTTWRCTDAAYRLMTKPGVNSSGSIGASSQSPINSLTSLPPKNEERLASQPRQPPKDTGLGGLLRRADDPIPDPMRVSGAGTRAPAHLAFRSHRTSYGRVDGAADARSLPVGYGATLPAAGSRSHLCPRLRGPGEGDGHQTGAVGTRSPWQRAYVVRLIGTLRRECLDHLTVFP